MGNIGSMITNMNAAKAEFQNRMDAIKVRNNCFFSSRSLKLKESYISFAQLFLLSYCIFFEGSVVPFQFLKNNVHSYVKKI